MNQWSSRKEAGTEFALDIIEYIATHANRNVLKIAIALIALYFLIVRKEERKYSKKFLKKVLNKNIGIIEIFKHFYTFSLVTADRYLFLTNNHNLKVHYIDGEKVKTLAEGGTGGFVISAHFGSFEAARSIVQKHSRVKLKILLNRNINKKLIKRFEESNAHFSNTIIDTDVDPYELAISIYSYIKSRHMIGVLADRKLSEESNASVTFLGELASFSLKPFLMAIACSVPVVLVFGVYEDNKYTVYSKIIYDSINVSREQRQSVADKILLQYVETLESLAKTHPYNWFNFYDIWEH